MSGCRTEAGRRLQILGPATDRETPVAKSSVCSRNSEDVGVSGAKLGASEVRDQLAVFDQVRWSLCGAMVVGYTARPQRLSIQLSLHKHTHPEPRQRQLRLSERSSHCNVCCPTKTTRDGDTNTQHTSARK